MLLTNLYLIIPIKSALTANSKQFYFDYQNGKYGYNTDPSRGAGTFSPFNSGDFKLSFILYALGSYPGPTGNPQATLTKTVTISYSNGSFTITNSTGSADGSGWSGHTTHVEYSITNAQIISNGYLTLSVVLDKHTTSL